MVGDVLPRAGGAQPDGVNVAGMQGKVRKGGLTPREREQLREANAAYWERPGARERFSAMMRARHRDPAFQRAFRASIERRGSPEVRARYAEATRESWKVRHVRDGGRRTKARC